MVIHGTLSCYQFRSKNTVMFWALPSECHHRRKQRGLVRGSDFVAINTTGKPDQARWSVSSEPNKLRSAFSIQLQKKQVAKALANLMCYQAVHVSDDLFFFNTCRFFKIPLSNPIILNIRRTFHMWGPTCTPILSLLTYLIPCHQDQLRKPQR